ncbi:hypothetical protein LUU34_00553400 [Aix galericulata]|nr:hypothetical protein LUU34_00553400 [Aix galericulata]
MIRQAHPQGDDVGIRLKKKDSLNPRNRQIFETATMLAPQGSQARNPPGLEWHVAVEHPAVLELHGLGSGGQVVGCRSRGAMKLGAVVPGPTATAGQQKQEHQLVLSAAGAKIPCLSTTTCGFLDKEKVHELPEIFSGEGPLEMLTVSSIQLHRANTPWQGPAFCLGAAMVQCHWKEKGTAQCEWHRKPSRGGKRKRNRSTETEGSHCRSQEQQEPSTSVPEAQLHHSPTRAPDVFGADSSESLGNKANTATTQTPKHVAYNDVCKHLSRTGLHKARLTDEAYREPPCGAMEALAKPGTATSRFHRLPLSVPCHRQHRGAGGEREGPLEMSAQPWGAAGALGMLRPPPPPSFLLTGYCSLLPKFKCTMYKLSLAVEEAPDSQCPLETPGPHTALRRLPPALLQAALTSGGQRLALEQLYRHKYSYYLEMAQRSHGSTRTIKYDHSDIMFLVL